MEGGVNEEAYYKEEDYKEEELFDGTTPDMFFLENEEQLEKDNN